MTLKQCEISAGLCYFTSTSLQLFLLFCWFFTELFLLLFRLSLCSKVWCRVKINFIVRVLKVHWVHPAADANTVITLCLVWMKTKELLTVIIGLTHWKMLCVRPPDLTQVGSSPNSSQLSQVGSSQFLLPWVSGWVCAPTCLTPKWIQWTVHSMCFELRTQILNRLFHTFMAQLVTKYFIMHKVRIKMEINSYLLYINLS